MGKELRTLPVSLKVSRQPTVETSSWGLQNPQTFFPPLETLFKVEGLPNRAEYGVTLAERVESVVDAATIKTSKGRTATIHRKTTMLLSPFKWMRGDYGVFGLPKPEDVAADMQTKLQSPHSAGYVGALSSVLLSESGCIHFPKVYGVYVGLAKDHTIDISDDYEDLMEKRWFTDNLGKTFELQLRQVGEASPSFTHTRSQRPTVQLGEEECLEGIEDVAADHVSEPSSRSHEDDAESEESSFLDEEDSTDGEDEYEIESCDCESDSDASAESFHDDDEEEEPFAWATFHNVPVITTVMEKLDATFYELVAKHQEPEKHAAWVAQIVMALAFAQRTYGFVHNDLHGNNVMCAKTEEEFLYYRHLGIVYRIPTYGYILKLIDFDRAIVSARLSGMKEPRQFVSSQFQPDEEAAGQYNMEPFFNQERPHLPACPSFDLCRFATSVFWDMFPKGPSVQDPHPLFGIFLTWMTQGDGTSVMFRAKQDNHDRYHGFHLYKAIARYCKDAVPRKEIGKLLAFRVPTLPLGAPCLFLDA
jgi:hypothetical protein